MRWRPFQLNRGLPNGEGRNKLGYYKVEAQWKRAREEGNLAEQLECQYWVEETRTKAQHKVEARLQKEGWDDFFRTKKKPAKDLVVALNAISLRSKRILKSMRRCRRDWRSVGSQ